MQVADLPLLPGPPRADLKRRLLAEFLQNPMLDDDLSALSVRLEAKRSDLLQALTELCQTRFLREVGRRSYLLDLDFPVKGNWGLKFESGETGVLPKLAALPAEALIAHEGGSETQLTVAGLADFLPGGIALWRADGELLLANQKMQEWLEMPIEDLDADGFAVATGFHPLLVFGASPPLDFSLQVPRALEISLHDCCLPCGERVAMAVMRDRSVKEEIAVGQLAVHEELFNRLCEEVVTPLQLLDNYLENPAPSTLGEARAALARINWFMGDLLLCKRDMDAS